VWCVVSNDSTRRDDTAKDARDTYLERIGINETGNNFLACHVALLVKGLEVVVGRQDGVSEIVRECDQAVWADESSTPHLLTLFTDAV